jgi:hypothetical protein
VSQRENALKHLARIPLDESWSREHVHGGECRSKCMNKLTAKTDSYSVKNKSAAALQSCTKGEKRVRIGIVGWTNGPLSMLIKQIRMLNLAFADNDFESVKIARSRQRRTLRTRK